MTEAIPQVPPGSPLDTANADLAGALAIRSTRSVRAMLGGIATWGQSVLSVLVGFVATPYLVRFLGDRELGAYRMYESWAGYLAFISFALAGSVSIVAFRARDRGAPTATVLGILRSGMGLQMRQALLLLIPAALVFGWVMPEIVPVPPDLRAVLRWGAMAALLVAALVTPLGLFRSVLEYSQIGYRVSIAVAAQSLVITLLGVWLAWAGFGLPGMFAAGIVGTLVFHGLLAFFARGVVRPIRRSTPVAIDRRELWQLRWPLTAASVGNQVNLLSDVLIAGHMFGLEAVNPFTFTQRLINFAAGFTNTLGGVSWAPLVDLRARGESAAFEARLLELVRLMTGVGTAVVGAVVAYNEHFVRLWVGERYYGGHALSILTGAQGIIFGFYLLFAWVIDSQGHTRQRVVVSTIGSALKIGLSFALGAQFGLAGIALATCIAYATTDAWYCPLLFSRHYGVPMRRIALVLSEGLARGLPWAVALWYLARTLEIETRPELFVHLAAAGLASVAYSWVMVLSPTDRDLWRARLSRGRRG